MKNILLLLTFFGNAYFGNSQGLRTDQFNKNKINDNWMFINPNPGSSAALNGNGEFLIHASAKNGGSDLCTCSNFNAPRLLQKVDTSLHHWSVETKIRFSPANSYQAAGLIFQTSQDSSLGNVSNTIRIIDRFFLTSDGQRIGCPSGTTPFNDTITYLKAEKNIDSIRVYYSSDGITWKQFSSFASYTVYYAGISASRQPWDGKTNTDTYAYFDYFVVNNSIACSPCTPPNNLKTTGVTFNKAKLQWTGTDCAVRYNLQVRNSQVGNWQTIKIDASANSYIYKDLMPETQYQWRLATICQSDPKVTSKYSAIQKFTTPDVFAGFGNNNVAKILPNPAHTYASVYLQQFSTHMNVSITDFTGNVLYSNNFKNIGAQQRTDINLNKIHSGIYIINITTDKGIIRQQIVIE